MIWPFKSAAQKLADARVKLAGLEARAQYLRQIRETSVRCPGWFIDDIVNTEQAVAEAKARVQELQRLVQSKRVPPL